ncbi:unnamed protein product [Periconia digitata]|uniref:Zn(2)-C6 fungal-type domain-containing protein n=1 Tax=Periconia digitata TaxID=1303443 RepID=A0A9W4U8V2_9PLEO|nr:unnamed protein product [Periconia digitata]
MDVEWLRNWSRWHRKGLGRGDRIGSRRWPPLLPPLAAACSIRFSSSFKFPFSPYPPVQTRVRLSVLISTSGVCRTCSIHASVGPVMPKAQRSRACQQCRERRVKCDETPEICQQCRRLGLRCSGPIQGSVIIDMTDRVAKPRQRKKREPSTASASTTTALSLTTVDLQQHHIKPEPAESPIETRADLAVRPLSTSSPHGNNSTSGLVFVPDAAGPPPSSALSVVPQHWKPASSQWSEADADNAIATIRLQYRLTAYYRPSKIIPEALDVAFITHFVQLNHGVRPYSPEIPWITHLPRLRQNAIKPALRLSIRAASMAFYATIHQDAAILVDSYRWYTMSLECQRQSLQRLGVHAIPNEEEILVPIILSLYEVFAGTTTTSIWHHLSAAIRIIAMRGPQNCRGVTFPMFKAMRVSDAHLSMVFNKPSVFSSPEWMTIPFENQIKNAPMILADILLLTPSCIGLCNPRAGNMRSFFASPIPPGTDLGPAEQRTRQLLRSLDDWAIRFPHLLAATGADQTVTIDMQRLAISSPRSPTPEEPHLTLPDSFVALTAATYEANRLILTMLLDKVSADWSQSPTESVRSTTSTSPISPATSSLMDMAFASSKSILEISEYMESKHPVGFDFMRSVFPLVVVACIGPGEERMRTGRRMLERWGKKRGMAGLCAAWLQESI